MIHIRYIPQLRGIGLSCKTAVRTLWDCETSVRGGLRLLCGMFGILIKEFRDC